MACQILCQNHDNCKFWTLGVTLYAGSCVLKSSDLGRQSLSGVISGPKFCYPTCDMIGKCGVSIDFHYLAQSTPKLLIFPQFYDTSTYNQSISFTYLQSSPDQHPLWSLPDGEGDLREVNPGSPSLAKDKEACWMLCKATARCNY